MNKLEKLERCFDTAIETNQKFIGILIETKGSPKAELIINERENFEIKLAYYKKVYDENLVLKTFNGIKIIGYAMGDDINNMYDYLKQVSIN